MPSSDTIYRCYNKCLYKSLFRTAEPFYIQETLKSFEDRLSSIMKTLLVITVLASLLLLANAVNYKKEFCGNQEYVGNPGSKYPHLHCGKGHLTVSRTHKQHYNVQGNCKKIDEILGDRKRFYNDIPAITSVLKAYSAEGCPTLLDQLLQFLF